jgi:hypothetical protein
VNATKPAALSARTDSKVANEDALARDESIHFEEVIKKRPEKQRDNKFKEKNRSKNQKKLLINKMKGTYERRG